MTDAKNAFELALENASTIPPMYERMAYQALEFDSVEAFKANKLIAITWEDAIRFFSDAFNEYLEEQKNAENKA